MSAIIPFRTTSQVWLGDLVNELGHVKAEIANLEKREKELRDAIIESGESACEGGLFRVTVSHASVKQVDYKAICEKLEPSVQLMTAHTKFSDRCTVKCVSR